MAKKNPIAQRSDVLSDQWTEFANDESARLLCWQFEPDELRMADAFLAMQADEHAGTAPDVFLTLETPFESPHGLSYSLYEAWVAEYRATGESLRAQGVDADWPYAPGNERSRDDIVFLVQRCQSFIAHYQLSRHLVLVLRPRAVSDPAQYQLWLQKLAHACPANVRVLIFDFAEAPVYSALVESEPRLVRPQRAALDMPTALEELSRDAGNLDTPGGQFRHLYVKLGNALKKHDLALAMQLGTAALGIATAEGWWHVAVPVHFALAAGLTGAGRIQDALAQYAAAESMALRGETEGAEEARAACKGMRLQARLGCGSTLIAGRAWSMAAKLYEDTAPLAAEVGDSRSVLDCHRLACFSHEQNGDPERAFRAGMEGMQVARAMDKQTLATSTFPYLGEGMLRLTSRAPSLRGMDAQIEREIVTITGTRDWRPKNPGTPAASSGAAATPS